MYFHSFFMDYQSPFSRLLKVFFKVYLKAGFESRLRVAFVVGYFDQQLLGEVGVKCSMVPGAIACGLRSGGSVAETVREEKTTSEDKK